MHLGHAFSRWGSRKDITSCGAGTTDREAQRLLDVFLLSLRSAYKSLYDENNDTLHKRAEARHLLDAPASTRREVFHAAMHAFEWAVANKRYLSGLYLVLDHLLPFYADRDSQQRLWTAFSATEFASMPQGLDLNLLLSLAERQIAADGFVSPELRRFLGRLRQRYLDAPYNVTRQKKTGEQILALAACQEFPIPGHGEPWAEAAIQDFARMEPGAQMDWMALFAHLSTADKAKPGTTWFKTAQKRISDIGEAAFFGYVTHWLHQHPLVNPYAPYPPIVNVTRGLLWCCSLSQDPPLAKAVGHATLSYFRALPGHGPRNARIANAGILSLGAMHCPQAIAELAKLRSAVRYHQALTQINKALECAALSANVSSEELEEMAVPTGSLDAAGRLYAEWGGYNVTVQITGVEAPVWNYRSVEDKEATELPNEVLKAHAEEWNSVQRAAREASELLLVQRDRLETLLMSDRQWDWQIWNERYVQNPLLTEMVRKLIWQFDSDTHSALGIWFEGAWVDQNGDVIDFIHANPASVRVRLWHPLHPTITDPSLVLQWRQWLEATRIVQPFPQAHREIYLLTDTERATGHYSNRFAAQIMRHYHFDKQAEKKHWKYDQSAQELTILKVLPHFGLKVELRLSRTQDTDTTSQQIPISLVVTGRLVFRNAQGLVPLPDVPVRVYSEVMREIGLLLASSRRGQDPTWHDSPSMSPTESDLASRHDPKIGRHRILSKLLPRLQIADRLTLEQDALIVRGDLHTYAIDLGYAQVSMGPERRYVCIQPAPNRQACEEKGSMYLPFEGDTILSVVLSKALLLADDTAITDKVIVRQIRPQAQKSVA